MQRPLGCATGCVKDFQSAAESFLQTVVIPRHKDLATLLALGSPDLGAGAGELVCVGSEAVKRNQGNLIFVDDGMVHGLGNCTAARMADNEDPVRSTRSDVGDRLVERTGTAETADGMCVVGIRWLVGIRCRPWPRVRKDLHVVGCLVRGAALPLRHVADCSPIAAEEEDTRDHSDPSLLSRQNLAA